MSPDSVCEVLAKKLKKMFSSLDKLNVEPL